MPDSCASPCAMRVRCRCPPGELLQLPACQVRNPHPFHRLGNLSPVSSQQGEQSAPVRPSPHLHGLADGARHGFGCPGVLDDECRTGGCLHRAAGRLEDPGRQGQQPGLPGTVPASQNRVGPRREGQRHVLQHLPVGVRKPHSAEPDARLTPATLSHLSRLNPARSLTCGGFLAHAPARRGRAGASRLLRFSGTWCTRNLVHPEPSAAFPPNGPEKSDLSCRRAARRRNACPLDRGGSSA